jgi:uncharacterized protein YcbX
MHLPVGTVAQLTRYPVKSMRGEQLSQAEVDRRGMVGDREWAVYTPDGGIGSGKSSRRFRRVVGLLGYRATLRDEPGAVPLIESPDGQRFPADDPGAGELLSTQLDRPVRLGQEADVRHYDESALHLISTAAVRKLAELLGGPVDIARFRPNLVLDVAGTDFVEDGWAGRELRLGSEVVVRLGAGMPRCVMVDLPQGELGPDGRLLKLLAAEHQLLFGIKVDVVRGGRIRLGDPAVLD